jgi:hypothetical protein
LAPSTRPGGAGAVAPSRRKSVARSFGSVRLELAIAPDYGRPKPAAKPRFQRLFGSAHPVA